MITRHSIFIQWLIKLLLVCVFLLLVTRTSWLNDDSYITFRTVDNFVRGYGLTWNPDERVQAYTHPLWMFTLSAVYTFTGNMFYTGHWLSIILSGLTILLVVFLIAQNEETAVFVTLALVFSKAFLDYSTSGLENPLTHLLLTLFLYTYYRQDHPPHHFFTLSLLTALLILNRLDILLLILPAYAWVFWQNRSIKTLSLAMMGFAPFIAWELFSIVYYGFPFPNTAYAKAFATGVPTFTLAQQGLLYLLNSLKWDPLTLVLITFSTLLIPYLSRSTSRTSHPSPLPPLLGLLLYLLYIIKIGGDFMSGRFLAAPFLLALITLLQLNWHISFHKSVFWLAFLVITSLGFAGKHPALLNGSDYGSRPEHQENWRDGDIADERMYYYPYTGLLNPNRQIHPWAGQGMDIHTNGPVVLEHGNIGFLGFYAGPTIHIVDRNGLADPLLARLPARNIAEWRIGHFRRTVPAGYTDGFWTAENHIADPALAAYYDKLLLVIRGPLFTRQRWQEIWKFNTGQYDPLLQQYLKTQHPIQ